MVVSIPVDFTFVHKGLLLIFSHVVPYRGQHATQFAKGLGVILLMGAFPGMQDKRYPLGTSCLDDSVFGRQFLLLADC